MWMVIYRRYAPLFARGDRSYNRHTIYDPSRYRECKQTRSFQGSARFPLGIAFSDNFALVVFLLPAGESEFNLYSGRLSIQPKRDQSQSFFSRRADEFPDFLFMKKEFSRPRRIIPGRRVRRLIGRDECVCQKRLSIPYDNKSAREVCAPGFD